jgi:hypothetical protein
MKRIRTWLYPLLALALVALAWAGPLDRLAEDQAQAGLKRALATFAAARALNGVISVAQGTEVAVEPGGVGVTFAPGQVLDPVNDLIEQFSTLMLTASVSFGVQTALIAIGGYWMVSLLLTLVVLLWLLWPDGGWPSPAAASAVAAPGATAAAGTAALQERRRRPPRLLGRILVLLLLVRFAVPIASVGSDSAFRWFLTERYERSQAALTLSATEVDQLAAPEQPPPGSLGERVQRWWSDASDAIDVSKRLEALKQAATRITEHVVELIVVFLLQTLIVPSLLLWALWKSALELTRRREE